MNSFSRLALNLAVHLSFSQTETDRFPFIILVRFPFFHMYPRQK